MRGISFILMVAACAPAQENDRPGTLQSGSASLSHNGTGYEFRYACVVEPPPAQMSDVRITGGISPTHRVIHREMTDEIHHQSFGYDVTIVPGQGQYTVTISPLTSRSTTATPVPLPKYPAPMVVKEGDTIALDLLVSPDGRQKVVDYIQVRGLPVAAAATSTGEPRDYSPDDGTLRINGDPMKVLVNGQFATVPAGVTIKRGATLWLTAPGQGRYILSLVPHEGFQKSGAIRDNVISFQSDGQQYEVRTAAPLLGSKGAWNLYVLHDPQFQSRTDVLSIGLDRMDNLLPKSTAPSRSRL